MMDRSDIDRVESILREMRSLKRSLRQDLDKFHELVLELKDLVSDLPYLSRKVSSEIRFFNDMSSRLRNFSVVSSVQRRLPDLRRLVRDEEEQEGTVKEGTKKVERKLSKLDRYLNNIG